MLHEPPNESRHESDRGYKKLEGGRREAGTCADQKTNLVLQVGPFGLVFVYMQLSTTWERLGLADKLRMLRTWLVCFNVDKCSARYCNSHNTNLCFPRPSAGLLASKNTSKISQRFSFSQPHLQLPGKTDVL